MLKHVELDPTFSLEQQYADTSDQTTILINLFDVDPADQGLLQAGVADRREVLRPERVHLRPAAPGPRRQPDVHELRGV